MARKKKGKLIKNVKKKQQKAEEDYSKAPHSLIFTRGDVGRNIRQLMVDFRKVMEPYTARELKTQRKGALKHYVSVAGPLGVSHFVTFSKSESSTNMRVMRLVRGPTITFRVKQYILSRDIISSLKKPSMYAHQFTHHPLLVMNNFSGEGLHLKLMSTMFQNMFPSIDVNKVVLNNIRRCVLLNYDPETRLIEFRHYSIKVVPMGVSKSTKKLIRTKVPDLSRYQDMSEFFLNAGYLSDSEAELDGPNNEVTLPQKVGGRGNSQSSQSAIRLVEIGPRLTLELLKIEEGLCEGEVLHHELVKKSKDEIAKLRNQSLKKSKLKAQRKKKQEENVKKKVKEREEHKERSMKGILKKKQQEESTEGAGHDDDDEDDTEYYRQEVGAEPDPDLFQKSSSSSKSNLRPAFLQKRKRKLDVAPSKEKNKKFQKAPNDSKRQKMDTRTSGKPEKKFTVSFTKSQMKGKGMHSKSKAFRRAGSFGGGRGKSNMGKNNKKR